MVKHNVKILFQINILVAIAVVLASPLFFSYRMVSDIEIAQIGEYYIAIIGIILFPYILQLENNGIWEVVGSKIITHRFISVLRLGIILLLTALLISLTGLFGILQHGNFNFITYVTGIWITAVYLGMIGYTVANVTNSTVAGYLVSFSYYIIELMTKGRYTKDIYLFSLQQGSFMEKNYLFAIIVLLLLINTVINKHPKAIS